MINQYEIAMSSNQLNGRRDRWYDEGPINDAIDTAKFMASNPAAAAAYLERESAGVPQRVIASTPENPLGLPPGGGEPSVSTTLSPITDTNDGKSEDEPEKKSITTRITEAVSSKSGKMIMGVVGIGLVAVIAARAFKSKESKPSTSSKSKAPVLSGTKLK